MADKHPRDDPRRWSGKNARLLAVVSNRKDRTLLADWLGRAYSVTAPDPESFPVSRAIFDGTFDLVILDGLAYERQRNLIKVLRERHEDVFMPILLITSRKSVQHATENLWRRVDDVILKPIEKAELYARVEVLLRARHYSLRLKERYTSLAEIAPVGMIVADRDGVIRYANTPAERIFVGGDFGLAGRSVRETWDLFDHSGRRLAVEERPFDRILATKEPVRDQQLGFRDHRGHEYRLSISGVPITTPEDEIESVLLTVNDVTEQVRQADELRRARDRAQEMSRLKTAFLANMSHEIRTPLTGILSSTEIIQDESQGKLKEFSDLILINARRLRRTLEAVFDLAQLESDTWRLSPGEADLTSVVHGVASEFRRLANERGVEIMVEAPSSCPVSHDEQALKRIVQVLVSNAVKFSRDAPIVVRLGCTSDAAFIEVEDEGVGIDDSFLPLIFDEFKQESVGSARAFEGSGLGLTIAKHLVTLMGGRIHVKSEKGRGSTFQIVLPRRSTEVLEAAERSSAVVHSEADVAALPVEAPETYLHVFERSPFPCFILDTESRTIRHASAAVRFYGYESHELTGTHFSEVCTSDAGPEREDDGEPGWSRWSLRAKDGTIHRVLAIRYRLPTSGHPYSVVHILDDAPVPETSFVRAEQLRQLQTLQSFSSRLASAKDRTSLYQTIDAAMREAFGDVDIAAIWRYDRNTDGLHLAAASGPRDEEELYAFSGFPEFRTFLSLEDVELISHSDNPLPEPFGSSRTYEHVQSLIIVPLRAGGDTMAILVLASSESSESTGYGDRQMIRAFATLAGMVIQRIRLIERLREASRLIIEVQESERRAISQDVHDEMGGLLNSLRLLLRMAEKADASAGEEVMEAVEIVDELIGHTRDLSFRLSPRMLGDLGLAPTINSYAKRFSTRTRIEVRLQIEIDSDARFPKEIESTAFRIVQESLTNASKHADPDLVQIHLRTEDDAILIHVFDDGHGFDPENRPATSGGYGLRGLAERVEMTGGTFRIVSSPGEGTRVSATLPVAPE